ncbi:hypothetical protein ACIHFC_36895, partial [Streptomyces sp. NPDC052013]|uniref:hypothetical protein n=1 Tax=Streptomyces sp. NPDC052013 TaxID=3365679 RepID=UPI0037D0A05C
MKLQRSFAFAAATLASVSGILALGANTAHAALYISDSGFELNDQSWKWSGSQPSAIGEPDEA